MYITQLKQELKALKQKSNIEPFRIKTYGIDKGTWLNNEKITLGEIKDLISGTLKFYYLEEPIQKAIEENQTFLVDPLSTPIKVKLILQILSKGLFYRYMIKLQCNSFVLGNSINHCSTEKNKKVIFSALLTYMSRKLTLQQIESALLIFNLESAVWREKAQGIPLDGSFLMKMLGKIERSISPTQLKIFIATTKQDQESEYIQAYEFIYLVAMSKQKSASQSLVCFYRQKQELIVNDKSTMPETQKSSDKQKVRAKTLHFSKVSGLTLYEQKGGRQSDKMFKQIKRCLMMKKRSNSTIQNTSKPRPASPVFRKSMAVFKEFMVNNNKFQQQVHNRRQKPNETKLKKTKKLKLHFRKTYV